MPSVTPSAPATRRPEGAGSARARRRRSRRRLRVQHAVLARGAGDEERGADERRQQRPCGSERDRNGEVRRNAAGIARMSQVRVGAVAHDMVAALMLDAHEVREEAVAVRRPDREQVAQQKDAERRDANLDREVRDL